MTLRSAPPLTQFHHRAGRNCESACLRNVFAAHGVELDEEILLGLDGGFGFGYFPASSCAPDIVIGRQEIFPGQAARLLGARMTEFQTGGVKALDQWLERGHPVILRVDLGALPYWQDRGGEPFGGYFVVLAGESATEDEKLLISDPAYTQTQVLTRAELQSARQSRATPPINPEQRAYVVETVATPPDLSKLALAAAYRLGRALSRPPTANFGLSALQRFAAEVGRWPRTKTEGGAAGARPQGGPARPSALLRQLICLGRAIDTFGTGGGLFRPMLSEFLLSTGAAGGVDALAEAGAELRESGAIWTGVGADCLALDGQASDAVLADLCSDIALRLERIFALEQAATQRLKSLGRGMACAPVQPASRTGFSEANP